MHVEGAVMIAQAISACMYNRGRDPLRKDPYRTPVPLGQPLLSDQVASKRRKPDVSVTYIKKIIKTTKHKETISDSTAVRDLIGKYWQLL